TLEHQRSARSCWRWAAHMDHIAVAEPRDRLAEALQAAAVLDLQIDLAAAAGLPDRSLARIDGDVGTIWLTLHEHHREPVLRWLVRLASRPQLTDDSQQKARLENHMMHLLPVDVTERCRQRTDR